MKTVKEKKLVVGADFAGFPLKEAVVTHLKAKGWEIEDLGVTVNSDPDDTENMFHRVGLRVGSKISEGEYERALLFCGTGMGINVSRDRNEKYDPSIISKYSRNADGMEEKILSLYSCGMSQRDISGR